MKLRLAPFQGGATLIVGKGQQTLDEDLEMLEMLEEMLRLPNPTERDLDPKTVVGSVILSLDHLVKTEAEAEEAIEFHNLEVNDPFKKFGIGKT